MKKSNIFFTDYQKAFINEHYKNMTYKEIGAITGRTEASIRNYCYEFGLRKINKWTQEEIDIVKEWYSSHECGELDGLLPLLNNRDKPNVSLLAKKLGISKSDRKKSEPHKEIMSINSTELYKKIGYRGGIKGKKHKPETIELLRKRTVDLQNNKEYKEKHSKAVSAGLKMAIKNGYRPGGDNPYSRTKSGKRDDLDGLFVRSAWEANYARYLNWLVSIGEIKEWEYEADTFEFVKIRKGTRFYLPDFKVTNNDGTVEYHEVKGWMDDKSKTKLSRMAKYYPDIKLILIDEGAYRAISSQVKNIIKNWE